MSTPILKRTLNSDQTINEALAKTILAGYEIFKSEWNYPSTIVAHLHCYNINKFKDFYTEEYMNPISEFCSNIIITYSIGNNIVDVVNTLKKAKTLTGKGQPIMIIMRTEMGFGVDYMMGSHKWHGVAPNDEQLEDALNQIDETIGDF